MHRKYSLFAHGFKKALTDEKKAEQDARLAVEAQTAVEQSRKAAGEAKINAAKSYAEQYTMSRWSRIGSIWMVAVQEHVWHHYSSLKKGKALHILCMVSASQSAENCALL